MNFSEDAEKKTFPLKLWLITAALLITLAGVGYWVYWGNFGKQTVPTPSGSDTAASAGQSTASKPLTALSDEQLERMVVQTKALLQKDAKNASAWAMLAHSYEMMGKFSEAAKAYAQLVPLLPNDAQVLADYADVLAVTKGRTFQGEPFALLKQALALDSKNVKALLLTGSAYIEQQDAAHALQYFEKARAASTDVALIAQIDAGIAQAKALSSGTPSPAGAASAAATASQQGKAAAVAPATGTPAQVSGRVWLAEDLRAKAPAQATLFLYARPVEGSRMPVALLRKKVSDLPLNFSLDDSMSMVPNTGLSKQSMVVVVARVSLRGNVTPAAGDLEGTSAPVAVGSKDLKLEITEVLR
jgi:cytochrome c-type biogenesis protein CcmH